MRKTNIPVAILILLALVTGGVAAIHVPPKIPRNLQVLPKDISDQKLDSIMQSFNIALGVNCKFCHVAFKNFPDSIDYVSDAEPMKEQARRMMRMNIYINKTYFYFDKNIQPEDLKTVHCNTCHKGEPFPEHWYFIIVMWYTLIGELAS